MSGCHTLGGVRKCEAERGYTISSSTIESMGVFIAAVASVSPATLKTPGGRESNVRSMLAIVCACQSLIFSHSGKISTVIGRWPSLISLAKAKTLPSSEVALAYEGVVYCNPQSTRM